MLVQRQAGSTKTVVVSPAATQKEEADDWPQRLTCPYLITVGLYGGFSHRSDI